MTDPQLDDDGDIGAFFRDWKAYWKGRRRANLEAAKDKFPEAARLMDSVPSIDGNYTWNCMFLGKHLQYYPTKGKWQYKGMIYHGGIQSFISWLRNQRTQTSQAHPR